ncbi:VacJ family lipoprotein [Comamonadaceae bacterium M7527]|nr:VacJ family lipoprotein [Comamonadaceae bacterium M7527]
MGCTLIRHLSATLLLLTAFVLGGCASGPSAHAQDPLEPFNRTIYTFNDTADRVVLKPVAETYQEVTHPFVRTTVSNFFGNLGDIWSSLNAALQLRPVEATTNFMRFVVNTGLGFGGLVDIATPMGLTKTSHDLGQTFGRWGVPMGPYIVLPFAGPSSLRDSASGYVELTGSGATEPNDVATRNTLKVVSVVNKRADLLDASNTLDSIALDKYSLVRDVYLKRRIAATQPMWVESPAADDWGDAVGDDDAWEAAPAAGQ